MLTNCMGVQSCRGLAVLHAAVARKRSMWVSLAGQNEKETWAWWSVTEKAFRPVSGELGPTWPVQACLGLFGLVRWALK